MWAQRMSTGGGTHACVFVVLRKKGGGRRDGDVEVTAWVCRGRGGSDGCIYLQIQLWHPLTCWEESG